MQKTELQRKLNDIHSLLTAVMWARDSRRVDKETEGLIEATEDKLDALENEIAQETEDPSILP